MKDYLLLYNLFGYPSKGSKRALVRALRERPANRPVRWQLFSPERNEAASGTPKKEPLTYGVCAYSCDFSAVTYPDLYTLAVTFDDGSRMESRAFDVSATPYLNQLSLRLSVKASQARFARGTRDGGFYDCNSRMGEAYSHGAYLNGLCWLDFLHHERLTPRERGALRWAERTAFDYLTALLSKETGEFSNYSPDRPYDARNFGKFNTIDALYGVCAYLRLIAPKNGARASGQIIESVERSFSFLRAQKERPDALSQYYHDEWTPVLCCHLYRISGKTAYLETAKDYLRREMARVDLRLIPGGHWRSVGLFEGMWMLWRLSPDTAQMPGWRECLARAETRLADLLARNAYHLPPLADSEYAARSWDDMRAFPEQGARNAWGVRWFSNNDVLLWGIEMCFLGLLTHNGDFFKVSAAALNFPCGVNFGLPGNMVTPPVKDRLTTASFFANTPHCANAWKRWYFRMQNEEWTSLENGYTLQGNTAEYSDESFLNSETFIKTDGLFLYLASLYECAVNDGMSALEKLRGTNRL